MSPGRTIAGDRRLARPGDRDPASGTAAVRPGALAASSPDLADVISHCRDLMAVRGLTPRSPRHQIDRVVHDVLAESPAMPDADLIERIATMLAGWGPVQALLDQPDIEEVWWNDPSRVFFARDGIAELSTVVLTESESRELVMRAITMCGRRLDSARPFVDAQLADGSRLHVVIPPITRRHWAVNIRRYVLRPTRLTDLVGIDVLSEEAAQFLDRAVVAGANIVISGGTQSGKTTALNALLGSSATQRVISCEEVRELSLDHGDWVALQTRDPGVEGTGQVSLRDLIRESLRMRPSRVVVGEVRGGESLDLLLAMNCGVPAAATIHANSAHDAVHKLTGLPLLAGPNISSDFVTRAVAACIDIVVQLAVTADGRRRVEQICSVTAGSDRPLIGQIFGRQGNDLVRGGAQIPQLMTSGSARC